MKTIRSMLLVPANQPEALDGAVGLGADAIVIDLEASVPDKDKNIDPKTMARIIKAMGAQGSDVLLRIENRDPFVIGGLDAGVQPGISGIMLPKAESAADVIFVDRYMGHLEGVRGMDVGSTPLFVLLESAAGIINAEEIVAASPRIEKISLGVGDYYRIMDLVPSDNKSEILFAMSRIVNIAKANGLGACGLVGQPEDFIDPEGYEKALIRALGLGCEGAPCVLPEQVAVANRIFSPSAEDIDWAQRAVAAFEAALAKGESVAHVDDKFVLDTVYEQAQRTLAKAQDFGLID